MASDFTQAFPRANERATQRTEGRIVYDATALYVAIRAFDSRPDSVASQLARRDASGIYSDWVHVAIDSYNDRRTAFRFSVNPSGVQKDVFHFNDTNEDLLWDAVWESATTRDSLGWAAELRIPLSQLRYSLRDGETARWGVQFYRELARVGERSYWSPSPIDAPGFVSRFGELRGLDSLRNPTRLEVTPYVSAQVTRAPGESADPFYEATDARSSLGADLRYGLPAGFTLTATINPDFGQVEVDPAVVNLSAFEVFFPERRPFFLEGVDIFRYGGTVTFNDNNPSQFFYTRRIGRAPQRRIGGDSVAWSDVPERTSILAAAKVSGKTASGWSLGVLGAATARENARLATGDGTRFSAPVEPRANYFVGRVRRDLRNGNTVVGGVLTGVRRDLDDAVFAPFLARNAFTTGLDFEHAWGQRTWSVSGFVAGSRVRGDRRMIAALQRSNTHLYQRPDATHLGVDSTRVSLAGYFGTISVAKTAGRHWVGSATYEETSPGFEVNDIGFQQRADYRSLSTALIYRENRIGSRLREYDVSINGTHAMNFGGDLAEHRYSTAASATLLNFWGISFFGNIQPETFNDRLTRGGPLAKSPTAWTASLEVSSDSRRAIIVRPGYSYDGNDAGEWSHSLELETDFRPSSALRIRVEPGIAREFDVDQFVASRRDPFASATFGTRYVFANLRQHEISLETRVDWTFSPTLSLQLFAQPFASTGRFSRYKEFARPRAFNFDVYGVDRGTIVNDASTKTMTVDPDGAGPALPFSFGDEDFTVRSLRGNAVVRWEYRPGSAIFFVWQQERSAFLEESRLGDRGVVGDLLRDPSTNVFLVKFTYWIGR